MLTELIKKLLSISLLLLFYLTGLIGCGGKQRPLAPDSSKTVAKSGGAGVAGSDSQSSSESVGTAATQDGVVVQGAGPGGSDGPAPAGQGGGAGGSTPPSTSAGAVSPVSESRDQVATSESPPPSISFETDIRPLFEKHCMECHVEGPPAIQWTVYDESMKYVKNGELLNRVWTLKDDELRGMPIGNMYKDEEEEPMTEKERVLIKNWMESGASP